MTETIKPLDHLEFIIYHFQSYFVSVRSISSWLYNYFSVFSDGDNYGHKFTIYFPQYASITCLASVVGTILIAT